MRSETIFRNAYPAFLALLVSGLWYVAQRDLTINLADEGFLWYGIWRTSLGEWPLRDFQSYYPGRYLWGALWSPLVGTGILGVRLSSALFLVVGMTAGLLALGRVTRSRTALALGGVLLALWMYPGYKVYDHCVTLVTLYVAMRLLERPDSLRYLLSGGWVGFSVLFERFHALYGAVAFLGLFVFLWARGYRKDFLRHVGLWVGGIVIGLLPLLLAALVVDGFWNALWESVLAVFKIKGGRDLSLPVPWPWKVTPVAGAPLETLQAWFLGGLFLLLPLFYGGCLLMLAFIKRWDPVKLPTISAALFVGVVYCHYIFQRADLDHMALGIHPFLIALLALPTVFLLFGKGVSPWALLVPLLAVSMTTIAPLAPYGMWPRKHQGALVEMPVGTDPLFLDPYHAKVVEGVRNAIAHHVGPNEEILIAPHWPTFYPILKKRAPLWDIYFLFRESDKRQEEQILELEREGVRWALIGDIPLDGKEFLRMKHTHARLWNYLMRHFEPIETTGLPPSHILYRKRS